MSKPSPDKAVYHNIPTLPHRDGAAELAVFAKQLSEDARLAIGMGLIRKAQLQPKYKLPRESPVYYMAHHLGPRTASFGVSLSVFVVVGGGSMLYLARSPS